MGCAGLGVGYPAQPVGESCEVDGYRGGYVLQVGLVQTSIAGLSQPERSNPLGYGAFDACPLAVGQAESFRLLTPPGLLDRLVLGPRLKSQAAWLAPGPGAQGSHRTRTAVGGIE